jgi:serine/threonine-protein phosphatase 2A regulatory subunit B'
MQQLPTTAAHAAVSQVFAAAGGGGGGGGGGAADAGSADDAGPALEAEIVQLPALRDAPTIEAKEELFLRKLLLCSVLCDFTTEFDEDDFDVMMQQKEVKLLTLVELTIAVRTDPQVLSGRVCEALCSMIAKNLFRDSPAPRIPNAPEFDPDEDDPMLVPEWEHLRLVYELLDKFLDSPAARRQDASRLYISEAFVNQILILFYNEDPRERILLKGVLHKIYGTYVSLRKNIRKTMEHMFIRATFDDRGRCNGIADLLQILGSIINGFALPLKEEHVYLLKKVLLPLHSASCFQQCHDELRYCTIQYVEKDGDLAWPVLQGLIRYWSKVNSTKQVLLLGEVEEVLNIISEPQFKLAQIAVFKQIAQCMASQHFQVAEGALSMMNRGRVENLVRKHKSMILPIVIPVLNRCITHKPYWNPTILGIAMCLRQKLKDMSPELFETTIDCLKRQRSESQGEKVDRDAKWRKLSEMAQKNPNPVEGMEDRLPNSARKNSDECAGMEEDDTAEDLDASFNSSSTPAPGLLVRRKSMLPHDMDIQAKISQFGKDQEEHFREPLAEPITPGAGAGAFGLAEVQAATDGDATMAESEDDA